MSKFDFINVANRALDWPRGSGAVQRDPSAAKLADYEGIAGISVPAVLLSIILMKPESISTTAGLLLCLCGLATAIKAGGALWYLRNRPPQTPSRYRIGPSQNFD